MVYYNLSGYNSDMFLTGILSWWYGSGLLGRVHITKDRLTASADFFSVGLLASTLFSPYKQISAGSVKGSLNDQMHAFFDRLVSRFIGAFIRSFIILFGIIAMIIQAVFGVVVLIFWLVIPLFPVVGLILMVIGRVPQWIV